MRDVGSGGSKSGERLTKRVDNGVVVVLHGSYSGALPVRREVSGTSYSAYAA